MIFGLGLLFIVLSAIVLGIDMFIPYLSAQHIVDTWSMMLPIRLMAFVFLFVGVFIIGVRIAPTNLGMFMDLPSSNSVPLIHSRVRGKDPDAKFLKGKRLDLELIRAKNKLFKDVGGGFRIAGHSCRRTYETIGFTIPDWLSQILHNYKEKYGLTNSDEFRELRKQLNGLYEGKKVVEKIKIGNEEVEREKTLSKEEQLNGIKMLEKVMTDPAKKKVLLDMGWDQLRHMEEFLFDGITHNGEEVELLIDSATPNEQDILEHQTFLNDIEREKRYRDPGEVNWEKWVPWIAFLMVTGVICAIMLQGVFGG